ncbi:MAG TPA: SDR family oxidoreductase [Chryseolinea sp.]|nr:SDR family oxidoreductase [Chryseolinea sp.]
MSKLVVVTGGTKGIGRAVIEKFAAQDFDIATCSRNASDLEKLKSVTEKNFPSITVHVKKADLSRKIDVDTFCNFVNGMGRPIDVLVNNAGYFIPGEIVSEPDDTLEKMVNANLYSAYHTTRGLISTMIERRAGHIFNMCSIASFMAYPNGGSYAISKFALLGFSKCLREEVKTFGLKVTAVMPGAVLTESWEGTELPPERFMKAQDVADAIYGAYALSPNSIVEEIIIRPQLGDI